MSTATRATTERRHTAEERRDEIVAAAMEEFAIGGLHGTSTEAIARRVGISQPYLFRLFHTKKELFIAAVERCFAQTHDIMERAAKDLPPEATFKAMGEAYGVLLQDRTKLLMQMHAYAACEDPEVRDVVRRGFYDLHRFVGQVSGATTLEIRQFFA